MKKISLVLLLFSAAAGSFAQKDANEKNVTRAEADAFWETMPNPRYSVMDEQGLKTDKTHFFLQKKMNIGDDVSSLTDANWQKGKEYHEWLETFLEAQANYLREWGLVFWKRFPNDKRRFEWLKETIMMAPSYKKKAGSLYLAENELPDSLIYDLAGYERWNKFYQQYLAEYCSSDEITDEEKRSMEYHVLSTMLTDWKKFRAYQKFDYANWIDRAIKYACVNNEKNGNDLGPQFLINEFNYKVLEDLDRFGISEKETDVIVDRLLNSGVSAYEKVALSFQKPMTYLLEKTPLQFNVKSTDGRSVELSEYKGKLVLVDFWNLSCGSCISAMPKWREIYEKYNKYGFELISACFVAGNHYGRPVFKNEMAGIMAVHQKFSPGWPLVLLHSEPGSFKHKFYDLYQITGNPVYMLFDENGKPLMTNGELGRNPEKVIKEYLTKKGKIK